jgi:hypothetical protein
MNEPSLEDCSKAQLLAIAREQREELSRMRAHKLRLEEVIAELERPQSIINVEPQARALAGMLVGRLGDSVVDGATQMIMGFAQRLEASGYELRLLRIRGWLEAWLETKAANERRDGRAPEGKGGGSDGEAGR